MNTRLLAILLLAGGFSAPGQASPQEPGQQPAEAPASVSRDSRYIVEDENFEKAAGQAVGRLVKEGKLFNFSEIDKKIPKTRPGICVAAVSRRQLPPPDLAEALRHSTVALGLRYQEPKSRRRSPPGSCRPRST